MATRCQIRFIDEDGIAQIYQHFDGYPEAVIPKLIELREHLIDTQAQKTASYTAANYIFREKLKLALSLYGDEIKTIKDLLDATPNQPAYLLSYGVEDPANGVYGNERYLYIVNLTDVDEEGLTDWSVKVSDCGYDLGLKAVGFDGGRCAFEGTLEEASEKYKQIGEI